MTKSSYFKKFNRLHKKRRQG